MDKSINAVLQKLERPCSSLFQAIGSAQISKQAEEKKKNGSGVIVLLIFVTQFKISKINWCETK
jgi:hypothetical protein